MMEKLCIQDDRLVTKVEAKLEAKLNLGLPIVFHLHHPLSFQACNLCGNNFTDVLCDDRQNNMSIPKVMCPFSFLGFKS